MSKKGTVSEKDNLLLIFTRNPEPGKVKKRLSAKIGEKAALDIYRFLLKYTAEITKDLSCIKEVHYSEKIIENDLWDHSIYQKKLQKGKDLGERMEYAFKTGFEAGFKKIIIIGSDIFQLHQKDLEKAFSELQNSSFVIGPAKDGGYYLLGMKTLHPGIFKNKAWGTKTVLKETLGDLEGNSISLLEERNDIDTFEDITDEPIFQQFLKEV